jgi:hypothetical protein
MAQRSAAEGAPSDPAEPTVTNTDRIEQRLDRIIFLLERLVAHHVDRAALRPGMRGRRRLAARRQGS